MFADPLGRLGASGVGSPDDTAAFIDCLIDVGLNDRVAFLLLHHLRKEPTEDEIDEIAGAWGGHPDSLLLLKKTKAEDRVRLSFPKLRYARPRPALILAKLAETMSFEVIAQEGAEDERDVEAETLIFLARDENRGRWFTVKEIATAISRSEKDVRTALETVRQAGEVEFEKGPAGRNPTAKCYRLRGELTPQLTRLTSGPQATETVGELEGASLKSAPDSNSPTVAELSCVDSPDSAHLGEDGGW